ncbi:hypothetical protein F2P81_012845 [Scophthalmus maximus]|uniref:Acyl-coenzyme A thioesterase 4-like n=1 Tax=Scophthalmus maximus TaxID=52904 RepID=A0A6A4SPA4_SCOMX|nr:hypothetical protein F2P81_012845 [Scophthalmus maximus]
MMELHYHNGFLRLMFNIFEQREPTNGARSSLPVHTHTTSGGGLKLAPPGLTESAPVIPGQQKHHNAETTHECDINMAAHGREDNTMLEVTQEPGKVALCIGLRKKNVEIPYVVHVSLLDGHVSPSEGQSSELAAVTTERWYMAPGVRRIEIRQNKVVGTLFLPPGPGPFPGMLDLWGMGGGLVEYRSALFASRGYASLSLAYIGHKDLPGPHTSLNVGDSYFKSAFHLLQDHHQVCADRVGIIGLSFGVYLTLRMATQSGVKDISFLVNNMDMREICNSKCETSVNCPLSDQKYWTYDDQGVVTFKEVSLPANLYPGSIAKIENLTCPLMYIEGRDDLNAASTENANLVEETLRAADKSHLLTRLSYPGAGHLIEPPYTPNSRVSLWRVKPEKCEACSIAAFFILPELVVFAVCEL